MLNSDLRTFIHLTFNADFSATDGDFYTFTVCENAVFFAAAVICCAMFAKSGQEMPQLMRVVAKIASSSHPQKM